MGFLYRVSKKTDIFQMQIGHTALLQFDRRYTLCVSKKATLNIHDIRSVLQ